MKISTVRNTHLRGVYNIFRVPTLRKELSLQRSDESTLTSPKKRRSRYDRYRESNLYS